MFHTDYYVDNLTVKGADAILTGIGSMTLSKPMYLSSPSRVAYDIPNTVVNPAIRNKEMKFNCNIIKTAIPIFSWNVNYNWH